MKLKLDLHTHCLEATRFASPTVEIVGQIVANIKARGLDGIGISEHDNREYGFKVKEIVERHFNNEVLIIPGREVEVGYDQYEQMVELCLPDNTPFRFWVHPAYPAYYPRGFACVGGIHGIEINNGAHDEQMNKPALMKVAEKYKLITLSNSDAHHLEDIGRHYNEIDLDELSAHVRSVVRSY